MRHPRWLTLALCHITSSLSPRWHPCLYLLKPARRPALIFSSCVPAGNTYYPTCETSPVCVLETPRAEPLCSLSWIAVWLPQTSGLPCGFWPSKALFLELPFSFIIPATSHICPWLSEFNIKFTLSPLPSTPFHPMPLCLTYTSTERSHWLRMMPCHSWGVFPLSLGSICFLTQDHWGLEKS